MKLRQSTTVTIQLGPFVDATDGVTAETGLSPSVRVSKAGAVFAARNSATAIAHDENGFYRVELDTTDTNTVGRLIVAVTAAATHAPVWAEFDVIAGQAYDAQVAATGNGIRADVQQIAASAITATSIATSAITATKIASNAITSAKIAADAIGASQIAADAIGSSELATSAVTEIQSGLATSTALATVDSNVDAILVDTAAMQPTIATNLDVASSTLATASALATVDANVDAVLVDTAALDGRLTGTRAGYLDNLSAGAVAQQATLTAQTATLEARFDGVEGATFDTATDSLEAIRDRGDAAWTTGAGGSAPTVSEIADGVWDEARSGHATAGTFGEAIQTSAVATASALATVDANVDAVLVDTGTSGVIVATNNDKTGYAMAGTITSLDALDTAQDAQHATTQSAVGALNDVDSTAVQSAAAAALTAYDPPTNTELAAVQTALEARFTGVEGATFDTLTDSLEAIRDRGDAAWITGGGGGGGASWDDLLSSHVVAGSFGEAVQILMGMGLGQYYLDNITYDANGFPTAQRLRIFPASKDMTTVVEGAADDADGEIYRVDLVSSPVSGTVRAKTVRGAGT